MAARPSIVKTGRSLDQHGFDKVVALHERFLRGAGGARAFLRFADARGVDCRRRLLNEADLTGADLQDAVFAGSHLERASLYCANLRGCDLRASNLRRADLRGAHLAGANLNGAVMDEADMRAAYIVHAAADGGASAVHRGWRAAAENAGAQFTNCAMRGVRLCGANLKGVDFSGAVLDGADLSGAKLIDAIFRDTVLTSVSLERLKLSPGQLQGCVLDPDPAAIARVPILLDRLNGAADWVESGGKRGAPAAVDREDLRPLGGALRGRLLPALTARGARAVYLDFSGSRLVGAVFDHADLRGAVFEGADLRGASFRDARLSHARFNNADLRPLVLPNGRPHLPRFDGASMDRTDFSNTVLA